MKLPDEISVDLFECSLLKNIKIRFKNRGHHAIFPVLKVKRSKILQKLRLSTRESKESSHVHCIENYITNEQHLHIFLRNGNDHSLFKTFICFL